MILINIFLDFLPARITPLTTFSRLCPILSKNNDGSYNLTKKINKILENLFAKDY